jgi:phosphatidylglycerophosphate synthase
VSVCAVLCYLGAFTGDLFDGMAARYFNQCE